MELETKELILGLLAENDEQESNNHDAKTQFRINRDSALLLTLMYPKTFPKALRLLEFCNVDAVVLNGAKKRNLYRNLRDVVCRSELYVLLFRKDQQQAMVDDDSDDEFVARYNTQKKYYKRNDKVYKYEYHKSNRYRLEKPEGNQDVRLDYRRRVCSCHGFVTAFYGSTDSTGEALRENAICEHLFFVDMVVMNPRLMEVKPLEQQNIVSFTDPDAMMNFLLEN